ncbi:site-specific integrase [Hugenholtzia roseola]|uniref:site-specific integrase n=1 Tax=Hugenholtzia roseola TaxID=1002 RepID=UPI000687BF8F|nr:site-specific integrase [Hugenholtzia roseola]
MNICFYRRKVNDKHYIYCKILYNSVYCLPFSVGIKLESPKQWQKGRFVGKFAQQYNDRITLIKSDLLQIYNRLVSLKEDITAQKIKDLYQNGEKPPISVLELYKGFIQKKLDDKTLADTTLQKYRLHLQEFEMFCNENHCMALQASNFGMQEVQSYFVFLSKKGNSLVTIRKKIGSLQKAFEEAELSELIPKSKIKAFRIKVRSQRKAIIFLTAKELSKLEQTQMPNERLEKIKDLFLFQCYTGLSFADMARFEFARDVRKEGDVFWLQMQRQKTGTPFFVPLLEKKVFILLEKYKNKLPLLGNGNYNVYLKEVAQVAKIDKPLTTHVGRKTFANAMLAKKGVSFEVLAKMLGHSDTRVTGEHYAQVLKERILKEMI